MVHSLITRSPAPLIDIGVNLADKSFEKDRADIIERAKAANVAAMVVTGTNLRTTEAASKICDQYKDYPLFFTAGVHPHHAKQCDEHTLAHLTKLLSHPKCVAVGECGLDFNRNFSAPDVQEVWFDKQVQLAKELRKPLFMHCRDAAQSFIKIIRKHQPLTAPAVVHCFTGNKQELLMFLEAGLHIGITGWICDERPERGGAELSQLLHLIPDDKLMLETDAPYITPRTITPSKVRPGRNEPALLPYVLNTAAAALGKSTEQLAHETTRNAAAVFGLRGFV